EAARPAAALPLLGERQRALQRARLDPEQLEIVVEPGCGLEAAVETRVAGDLPALVADHDLAGADRRLHPQPDQRDRHRVAVLPDRDQGLRVHPRRGVLSRLVVLERQLPERSPLEPERLTDRLGAAGDPPPELAEAAVVEQ